MSTNKGIVSYGPKDVIERIPTHPARLIAELTPRGWLEKQREQRPPDPPDPAIPAAPS